MLRNVMGAVKCSGCGKEILPDLYNGGPLWCPDCKKNLNDKGEFLPEGEDW